MVLKWLVAVGVVAAIIPLGMHQIPEGHVGIYYRHVERYRLRMEQQPAY